MTRHWTSAEVAACGWHRRSLMPVFFLALSACSDVPESPSPSTPPGGPSEVQSSESAVLTEATSFLLTGVPSGPRFDIWICGDSAGTNLGYAFAANGNSAAGGSGHEVLLAERRSRAFRWAMSGKDHLQIQFSDDESLIEWQKLSRENGGRLTLENSERGLLRCVRQTVEAEPVLVQQPVENDVGTSAGTDLPGQLPGRHAGNQANGLSSEGASTVLSLWVCESQSGLLAQAYFVPESEEVQGQFIEASGINAVNRGRWMSTAVDVVRLDLVTQGEVMLSEVRLDQPTRFSANSDRDGPLSCELESLSVTVRQDPS